MCLPGFGWVWAWPQGLASEGFEAAGAWLARHGGGWGALQRPSSRQKNLIFPGHMSVAKSLEPSVREGREESRKIQQAVARASSLGPLAGAWQLEPSREALARITKLKVSTPQRVHHLMVDPVEGMKFLRVDPMKVRKGLT